MPCEMGGLAGTIGASLIRTDKGFLTGVGPCVSDEMSWLRECLTASLMKASEWTFTSMYVHVDVEILCSYRCEGTLIIVTREGFQLFMCQLMSAQILCSLKGSGAAWKGTLSSFQAIMYRALMSSEIVCRCERGSACGARKLHRNK